MVNNLTIRSSLLIKICYVCKKTKKGFNYFGEVFLTDQVPDDHLGAGHHSQVEGHQLLGVLSGGVHIGLDTHQKQHTLYVTLLYGSVEKVVPLVIHLNEKRKSE